MASAIKRLPTHPHDRAVTLVKDSMPKRDYRDFPEPVAEVLRERAITGAVHYAELESVTDMAARLAEDIDSSDGVVVDVSDDADAHSLRHHLWAVEQALGDDGR